MLVASDYLDQSGVGSGEEAEDAKEADGNVLGETELANVVPEDDAVEDRREDEGEERRADCSDERDEQPNVGDERSKQN